MKTPNSIILILLVLLLSASFSIANAQTNQAPSQSKNNLLTPCPNDSANPATQTIPEDSGDKVEGDKTLEKNDWQKPVDRYQDLWKSDKRKDFRRFLDMIKAQPIV